MGWLELIPLLKRLLPLLSRVAPMLEAFVVARASNGKEAEANLNRIAGDLKSELTTATAENQAALSRTLASHTESLRVVSSDIQRLHLASSEQDARLEAIEMHLAGLTRSLKNLTVTAILLLILCVSLLLAIFLRH